MTSLFDRFMVFCYRLIFFAAQPRIDFSIRHWFGVGNGSGVVCEDEYKLSKISSRLDGLSTPKELSLINPIKGRILHKIQLQSCTQGAS